MGFISMLFALPFIAGITMLSIGIFFLMIFLISSLIAFSSIFGELGKKSEQKGKVIISLILFIVPTVLIFIIFIRYYKIIKIVGVLFLLLLVLLTIFVERLIFWLIYYLKNKNDYTKKKIKNSIIESIVIFILFIVMILVLLIKNYLLV